MAKKVKEGNVVYWIDSQGIRVPQNYIKQEDRERDKLVERIISDVIKMNKQLLELKKQIGEKTAAYLQKVAESYGEDWKGNCRLNSFSGDKQIEISVSDLIDFDEKLQVAKSKIDECIKRWAKGTNKPLELLVTKAFRTDKKGQLNKSMILQLRTYDIKDPEWEAAMDLISSSIRVMSSKTYYNFYVKDESGKLVPVHMNFSQL
ncbi:MAG: DUF3164 family protein [bacterium]